MALRPSRPPLLLLAVGAAADGGSFLRTAERTRASCAPRGLTPPITSAGCDAPSFDASPLSPIARALTRKTRLRVRFGSRSWTSIPAFDPSGQPAPSRSSKFARGVGVASSGFGVAGQPRANVRGATSPRCRRSGERAPSIDEGRPCQVSGLK